MNFDSRFGLVAPIALVMPFLGGCSPTKLDSEKCGNDMAKRINDTPPDSRIIFSKEVDITFQGKEVRELIFGGWDKSNSDYYKYYVSYEGQKVVTMFTHDKLVDGKYKFEATTANLIDGERVLGKFKIIGEYPKAGNSQTSQNTEATTPTPKTHLISGQELMSDTVRSWFEGKRVQFPATIAKVDEKLGTDVLAVAKTKHGDEIILLRPQAGKELPLGAFYIEGTVTKDPTLNQYVLSDVTVVNESVPTPKKPDWGAKK